MDRIGLFFKCQSCSDYVLTSNIQCPNGHQVCHNCFENLSHCPTCHQRVAPSTRIPFLLTTNVDPILNVGDSFDLLLPSLLRIAPALHPCAADEMIFTGKQQNLNLNSLNNDSSMQKNNNIADQLLMANSGEVEETLSRLMMLASMSPGPNTSTPEPNKIESIPPPGLVGSSTPISSTTTATTTINNAGGAAGTVAAGIVSTNQSIGGVNLTANNQHQKLDSFLEF